MDEKKLQEFNEKLIKLQEEYGVQLIAQPSIGLAPMPPKEEVPVEEPKAEEVEAEVVEK